MGALVTQPSASAGAYRTAEVPPIIVIHSGETGTVLNRAVAVWFVGEDSALHASLVLRPRVLPTGHQQGQL